MGEVDLKLQLALVIECLQAILPICHRAGVLTLDVDSYDEWENLVRAVFSSFVVLPVCDETGLYRYDEFHKLGFVPKSGTCFLRIETSEGSWRLIDIVHRVGDEIALVVQSIETNQRDCDMIADLSVVNSIAVERLN